MAVMTTVNYDLEFQSLCYIIYFPFSFFLAYCRSDRINVSLAFTFCIMFVTLFLTIFVLISNSESYTIAYTFPLFCRLQLNPDGQFFSDVFAILKNFRQI